MDGAANPPDRRAPEVALVPPESRAPGSPVLAMRWVHDLPAFERLPVDGQERVVGRTKCDSVELPADRKPREAHIAHFSRPTSGAYYFAPPLTALDALG
ncbi:MAG: porphyrinogen peroxidase [Solirubrobacteraceae bacterium]|nr:porphyrinogen peroxidase [Solirubrobacteraceae bacterium]